MDQYSRTGRRKIYLAMAGLVIMLIPLFYANFLAGKLAIRERSKVEMYARTIEEINNNRDLNADFTYHHDMLERLRDLPMITVREDGSIHDMINFPKGTDTVKALAELKVSGIPPIEGEGYTRFIYYKYPSIMTWIQYFPLIQVFLLLLYAGIGYAVFNISRREEQNRVWVGMAKETAHQLGTPISGILGWVEALKSNDLADMSKDDIIKEIEFDTQKLQQVADRFSKIGSAPELEIRSLVPELIIAKDYMKARAPKKVAFDFPLNEGKEYRAKVNPNLFSWVLENLLRNALDAMEGTGKITASIYEEDQMVHIDISDTGKGIPSSKFSTIFKPGYSTKSRGWGLGLSLAKRIIENYHQGKIFVKNSEPGKGTTITIHLPVVA
ncbi:MAG: HAMP domain-containing histidine kinase [Bacteroidota bacterium]|nr:HAMP domain-containing histidine kinase [Bacteroidota bacterium]